MGGTYIKGTRDGYFRRAGKDTGKRIGQYQEEIRRD
jgi:hypothetical protein